MNQIKTLFGILRCWCLIRLKCKSVITKSTPAAVRRLAKKIAELKKGNKLNDVLFIVGGTLPIEHISILKDIGVDEVFRSGSQIKDIIEYIKSNIKRDRKVY